MEQITLTTRKAEMRTQLKQARAAIPDRLRLQYSKAIFNTLTGLDEIQNAATVFIYISYGNEVDTHDLLRHFLAVGKTLAVPKILPAKTMIAVPFSRWEDLAPGELGILTPRDHQAHPGPFDVAITPGLGYTTEGYRIGYGRGYYDRWFATRQVRHKIAITFEAQMVNTLPVAETDVPVDIIVTETRVIKT